MPPEAVPSNASVASTGKGIRYIGQHCYAYSGEVSATTTAQTVLDFVTGSGYIVGKFNTQGGIMFSTTGGLTSAFQISFNDQVVSLTQHDNQTDHASGALGLIDIIIPPFTHVKVEVDSDDTNANVFTTVLLTGRVYGAT